MQPFSKVIASYILEASEVQIYQQQTTYFCTHMANYSWKWHKIKALKATAHTARHIH